MRFNRSLFLVCVLAAIGAAALVGLMFRSPGARVAVAAGSAAPAPAKSLVYEPIPIGAPATAFGRPIVTHVQVVDLDRDGLADVLYCEASTNSVRWIRQAPRGVFTETVIGESIPGPAHVWAGDVNGSGRLDVLVASMGQVLPTNDRIGSVVALENLDNQRFRRRVLLEKVARVTDVRAANLTGHKDGRLDIVVGQFGYAQGETRWMENRGNWNFESHVVSTLSGTVHTPVADFDGDGRMDFAVLISQEWEEVHVFRNLGNGSFEDTIAWGSTNEDYGSSGLDAVDLNRDGRPDLIYTNGDGFDYPGADSRPWHGIQWLENKGGGKFAFHRVGHLSGAYSPCAADLDSDGDLDLLAVSCFADWKNPQSVSMMAWLNDSEQRFTPVVLAHTPTHLVTAAVGDLDGNGVPVIVTGGMYFFSTVRQPAQRDIVAKKINRRPALATDASAADRNPGQLARRRRPQWVAVALAAALGVIVVGGSMLAWKWHRRPVRTAVTLPALPDLSGKPAELRERMQQAFGSAQNRATALDGIAELGRLFHANGYIAEAEACWQFLRAEQPLNARWSYYLADIRRLMSDNPGMAILLDRTTVLAPDYAPAWLQLADLQFKSGQLAEAEHGYRKRLALVPGDAYARLGLARVAMQQGRSKEAREQIEGLVKDAPTFPPSRNLYAEMLAADGDQARANKERSLGGQTGRFRAADDPWLEELDDWCFDYDRLCIRGTIDSQTKHGDRGKAAFERAIRLRPEALTAYELLGNLYLELNDAASARETYEQGLRQAKSAKPSANFYVSLNRAYRLLKQPAEAVRVTREGLAQLGEAYELYDALGSALVDLGEATAAVEAARTAVARNPGDAGVNYNLANALIAAHRLDEAVEALQRSLAAQPGFTSSLILMAQIEIDSGRWQGAVQYLRRLYEANPELPEAREKMAYGLFRAGTEAETNRDFATAEQHYRAALAIEGQRAELHSRLGALYLAQSRFTEAVGPLETNQRLQPASAQGALLLGQAYAALGRRDEARKILTEGTQLAERAGNTAIAQRGRELLRRLP